MSETFSIKIQYVVLVHDVVRPEQGNSSSYQKKPRFFSVTYVYIVLLYASETLSTYIQEHRYRFPSFYAVDMDPENSLA